MASDLMQLKEKKMLVLIGEAGRMKIFLSAMK